MKGKPRGRWASVTKKNRRILGAVLTIAAVAVLVATWQAPLIARISGIAPSPGSTNDDDSSSSDEVDFALFTTEATDQDGNPATPDVFDDFVGCAAVPDDLLDPEPAFVIRISVTNFDPDENRLNIIFGTLITGTFVATDLVTYLVLTGTSFHLTRIAGTEFGEDDVIVINPLDQDGDVHPMVGWISVMEGEEGDVDSLGCAGTTATV